MSNALIARNARKHYAAGVPVWNPTLGAYYVLAYTTGTPKFLLPTMHTWARIEARGKRKGSTLPRVPVERILHLHMMGLAA